jgi:hypothetical protein
MRASRVLIIGVVALLAGFGLVGVVGMLLPQQAAGPAPVMLAPAPAPPAPAARPAAAPTPAARPAPRPAEQRREAVSLPTAVPTAVPQQARAPKVDDDVATGRAQHEMASKLCSRYGVSC